MANATAPSSSNDAPSSTEGMFERWRQRFSSVTGLGATEAEKVAGLQAAQHKRCEKWKVELMNKSQYHHAVLTCVVI